MCLCKCVVFLFIITVCCIFIFIKQEVGKKRSWVKFKPHFEGNQASDQTAGEKCEEKSCPTEIHGKVIIHFTGARILPPVIYRLNMYRYIDAHAHIFAFLL